GLRIADCELSKSNPQAGDWYSQRTFFRCLAAGRPADKPHRPLAHDPMPSVTRRQFLSRTSAAAVAATAWPALALGPAAMEKKQPGGREQKCDVLIVGGSLGGIAAALAAARMGRSVIVTEETSWIGGQATTQGVPLDEHPWIEDFGSTKSYRDFRTGVREYYRRHYPLSAAARGDPHLNPGAAWVTALAFEPRVGIAVLHEMLAPHLSSGRIVVLTRHR